MMRSLVFSYFALFSIVCNASEMLPYANARRSGKNYVTLKYLPQYVQASRLLNEPADKLIGFIQSQDQLHEKSDEKTDLVTFQKLIDDCHDINIRKFDKDPYKCWQTPLMFAIKQGNEKVVKHLLKQPDIDVNQQSYCGITPLIMAIFKKNESAMQILLNDPRIDINAEGTWEYCTKTALDHVQLLESHYRNLGEYVIFEEKNREDGQEYIVQANYFKKIAGILKQHKAKSSSIRLSELFYYLPPINLAECFSDSLFTKS